MRTVVNVLLTNELVGEKSFSVVETLELDYVPLNVFLSTGNLLASTAPFGSCLSYLSKI